MRGLRILVSVLLAASFAALSIATDPRHDLTRLPNGCSSCHMTHNAPGGVITTVAGNANVCTSCHVAGQPGAAKPLASGDQALPWPNSMQLPGAGSGTSHRWDSSAAGRVSFGGGATTPSTGTVISGGSYTGVYPTTYTITVTTAGSATTAVFSWTATTPPGGSGSITAGTNVILSSQGITLTFANGSGTPSFQFNDKWYIYVRPSINNPSTLAMTLRAPNGVIMCSTCHDEHSQAKLPFGLNPPAYTGPGTGDGRHFQRVDNNTDQMCKECHSAFNVTASASGSHPVGVGIPGGNYKTPTTLPRDSNSQVACQSCHQVHYSPAADGSLRRLSNTNTLCVDCHTNSDTTTPAVHLSATLGAQWPGGQYGSQFPQITVAAKKGFCTNCHQPHGWPDNTTTPINTANHYPKLLVELADFSDTKTDQATAENLCYTCHDSNGPAPTDAKSTFPVPGVPTNNNYQDTFPAQAYNNSTGTVSWSGNAWTETEGTGGSAGAIAGYIMVLTSTSTPTYANCPTPNNNCLQERGNYTTNHIYRNATLPIGATAILTFDWKLVTGGAYQLRCSPGTTTYTNIGTPYSTPGTTGTATINPIPSGCISATGVTRIDFIVSTVNSTGYFYVDNVNIAYTTTSAGMVSGHPVDDTMQTSGPYRSVECRDCHQVHKATGRSHTYATTATSTRNLVSNPLKGISGLSVNYTGLGNFVAPSAGNYSAATPAVYEYQICFKCHSASTWSFGTAPNGMSANGSATRPVQTDLAQEFSSMNKSGHPVVTGLDNYANSTAVGSPAKKGLQLTYLKTPWNGAGMNGVQTMMCSDCHNTDAASGAAAQGPHGSASQFLLRGPNSNNWPNVALSTFATSWCQNCHVNFGGIHTRSEHTSSMCSACHIVIPHGGKMSRLIGDRETMPARYAYSNTLTNMYLSSFTKNAAASYSQSNCQSAQSGCSSAHGTAASENW